MNTQRILYLILGLAFITSCKNEPKQLEWIDGVPEDYSKHDKIIMVDFYRDDCSPCVRMDKETFSDSAVNLFLVQNFYCCKVKKGKENWDHIEQKYRVYGIPTFVFFNDNGEEIERLMYFMDAELFLSEIKRIEKGKDTYLDLKKRLEKDPDNKELILKLAEKEARIGRKGDESSQALWKRLIDVSDKNTYESDYAKCNYFTGILWKYEQPDSLINLLEQTGDSRFNLDGFKTIIDFYQYKKDTVNELKYYKLYSDYLFKNKEIYQGEKLTTFLDKYSWRMTDLEMNLEDALVKIEYVISNTNSNIDVTKKASFLDTKSEVLWKLGKQEEALKIEEQCIILLPDNEYLKEKKVKLEQEI